ncbi:MAG: serine/threonine-protein kinase [Pseudomonadota bacterium]
MAHGNMIGGKYELLRKIAAGGMAEVYLAKQTGLVGFEKLVVIKRILPHLSENDEFVRMFLDEARTAADLRHANVVQIYEVGEDQGTYYIAMEFLHGQDLRRILRRQIELGGRVPLQHALQMVIDAAAGLHYAHQKADLQGRALGIVHRDISPQNIIVTYDGSTKIVDFGIAKAASQSTETRSGVLKGKYSYMSPEQASGEQIDQRTDQFALGIVAFELTTATRLFKYPNEIMTLHAIIECRITPPAHVLRGYPVDLNDILMKVLAKDRNDRYPDLATFASELEEYMAREGMVHSPARVAEYMKDLFADVIEQEAQLGHPLVDDETSGPSDIQRATARATVREERGKRDVVQQQPTMATTPGRRNTSQVRAETLATASTQPPHEVAAGAASPGKRAGLVAAAVAALAVVAGGVWWVAKGGSGPDNSGRVIVETDPAGASVFIDGVEFDGKTPTVIPNLEVGRTYVIKVTEFGYDSQQVQVQPIAGKPVSVRRQLLKATGSFGVVKFISKPPGAKVYIDGTQADGQTPFELGKLKVGEEHTAVFMLDGHTDATTKFKVQEGMTGVEVELFKPGDVKPAILSIVTVPGGASVLVDGEKVGVSPIAALERAPTQGVEIRVELDGYKGATQSVDLQPGAARAVTFTLEAIVNTGTVVLTSSPTGASVMLGERELGTTPLAPLKLEPGEYTFVLEHKGVRVEETAVVEVGKTLKLSVKMPTRSTTPPPPKGKGTLKVVIPGSWADVYVNGKLIGTTPFKPIKLPAGSYKVRLVNKDLGKDLTVPVKIDPNKEYKLSKRFD